MQYGHITDWSVPYHDYDPIDIGLRWGARDEPDDPRQVDWTVRRGAALVPYAVRDGWPLHPDGRTGRIGRDADRWGENPCADALVTVPAQVRGGVLVLLIRRADCGDWALPGGGQDAGETGPQAARRELAEEAGLELEAEPQIWSVQTVSDPRDTDHAWYATTVCRWHVQVAAPVSGGDDATAASWLPLAGMHRTLQERGQRVYQPHRPILDRAADMLMLHRTS